MPLAIFSWFILLWYNYFYSDSCVTLLFYLYALAGICFSISAGRECREQQFTILRHRYFIADFALPIFCESELFRQQSSYSFFLGARYFALPCVLEVI